MSTSTQHEPQQYQFRADRVNVPGRRYFTPARTFRSLSEAAEWIQGVSNDLATEKLERGLYDEIEIMAAVGPAEEEASNMRQATRTQTQTTTRYANAIRCCGKHGIHVIKLDKPAEIVGARGQFIRITHQPDVDRIHIAQAALPEAVGCIYACNDKVLWNTGALEY